MYVYLIIFIILLFIYLLLSSYLIYLYIYLQSIYLYIYLSIYLSRYECQGWCREEPECQAASFSFVVSKSIIFSHFPFRSLTKRGKVGKMKDSELFSDVLLWSTTCTLSRNKQISVFKLLQHFKVCPVSFCMNFFLCC